MITRIYGPTGSGKSRTVTEMIGRDIENGVGVFLVVPEQQAVNRERELIDQLGNRSNLYVEVVNFRRLTNRVAREYGGLTYSYMDEGTRALLMNRVLTQTSENLTEFSGAGENFQLISRILSSLDELRMCCVEPMKLMEAAEADQIGDGLRGKLNDIALIYSAYTQSASDGPADVHDAPAILYRSLSENPAFFAGKKVYFDSFNGMTAEQLRIVELIAASAAEVVFTVCMRPDEEGDVFVKVRSYADALGELAQRRELELCDICMPEPSRFTNPVMAYLERQLFADDVQPYREEITEEVSVISCADVFAEAECAANLVSFLVREKGYMYRDIAISAASLDRYAGVLDLTFEKAGIPLFLSRRTDLSVMPIIMLALSAFEVVNTGWATAAVLRYIKSGLTPLTTDESDELALYALSWEIRGAKWYSPRDWTMHPDGYIAYEEGSEVALRVARINTLRLSLVAPLRQFEKAVKKASATELSRAVYELLIAVGADKRLETPLEGQLWAILCGILDRMASILGAEEIHPRKYAELFKIVVQSSDIGSIPSSVDEVTACNAGLLRVGDVKCTILLGVNEGIFPPGASEDSVFSYRDKAALEKLGIHLNGDPARRMSDELFNFYFSACSPSDRLYILYARGEPGGGGLSPSLMAERVLELFPQIRTRSEIPYENKRYIGRIQYKQSGFDMLGQTLPEDTDGVIRASLEEYFRRDPVYGPVMERSRDTVSAEEGISPSLARGMFADQSMTPSRLEDYSRCSFMYFCKHVLKLRPLGEARLKPSDIGNFVHEILEKFIRDVYERHHITLGEVTDEYIELEVSRLIDVYLKLVISDFSEKSSRFKYLFLRLKSVLGLLIRSLRDELGDSDFVPSGFEVPIGGDDLPPVVIPTPSGTLTLYGKVDRVDTFRNPRDGAIYLRVVDYKTGAKKFSVGDVLSGLNLQMLIYLFALVKGGAERFGEELRPAGVLYLPAVRPEYRSDPMSAEDDAFIEKKTADALRRNGLLLDDADILQAMEKTRSGAFIEKATLNAQNLASAERFGKLEKKINRILIGIAEDIARGSAAINPYRDRAHAACPWCEMAPVCRVEVSSRTKRDWKSINTKDAWEEIERD